MENSKSKQLEKDIEKLKRRNKILTNRVKRLQKENQRLSREMDIMEALAEKVKDIRQCKICPSCGNTMEILQSFGNKRIWFCSGKNCINREVELL